MAVPTNAVTSIGIGTAGGLREDLEDVIWDLFPEETYCLTNLEKVTAKATYHEWMKNDLAAAGANVSIEGDDHSGAAYTAPTRLGNYVQTSRKDWTVSGLANEVNKAGRNTESARIAMLRLRELKNDIEYGIVRNQASSAGGTGTGRASAGMESWLATNEILSTSTASATTVGFSSGVVAAPTDGTTTAAFTEVLLKSTVNSSWSAGGDPSVILINTTQKAVLDGFTGVATKYNEVKGAQQATLIGALDVYVSDVGNHTVVLHRHVRASVVLAIDPSYWALGFIRRPQFIDIAKTGDSDKRLALADWTLISRNEKASAKAVALT
jgi:hypothetical protein